MWTKNVKAFKGVVKRNPLKKGNTILYLFNERILIETLDEKRYLYVYC